MTSSYYLLQDVLLSTVYSHASCIMLGGVPHVAATKGTQIGLFVTEMSSSGSAERLVPLWEEDIGVSAVGMIVACDGSVCLLTDDGGFVIVSFDRDARRASLRFHARLICHDGDGAREPSPSFLPVMRRGDDAGSVIVAHAFEGFLHVIKVKLILASQMSVPFAGAIQFHRLDSYALSSFCLLPPLGRECQFSYIPLYNPDPSKARKAKGIVKRHQLTLNVTSLGSDMSTISMMTEGAPVYAVGGCEILFEKGAIEGCILTNEVIHVLARGKWSQFAHRIPGVRYGFMHHDMSNSPAMTILGEDGRLYQVLLHNQSDDCELACIAIRPTCSTGVSPITFQPNANESVASGGAWAAGVDIETGAVCLYDIAHNAIVTSVAAVSPVSDIEGRQHMCSAVDAGVVAGRGCFGSVTDVVVEPPRMAISAMRAAAHTHVTGVFAEGNRCQSWWSGWQQVSEHALHEPATLAVASSTRYLRRVASLLNTDTMYTIDAPASCLIPTCRNAGSTGGPSRIVLSSSTGSRSLNTSDTPLPSLDPNEETLASWGDVESALSLQVSGNFVKWVRGDGQTAYTSVISCTKASVASLKCPTTGESTVLLALGSPEGLKIISFKVKGGSVAVVGPPVVVDTKSVSSLTILTPFIGLQSFVVVFSLWGEEGAVRYAIVEEGLVSGEASHPMDCPLLQGATISSMWPLRDSHLLLQISTGAVFCTLNVFQKSESGTDTKIALTGTTTQLMRDDVLPGCVTTIAVADEVLVAMALSSGPLMVVGVPLQLLTAKKGCDKSLCTRLEASSCLGPISSRLFAHPLLSTHTTLTAVEFVGVFQQVGAPLSVQLALASNRHTVVVELRGTFRYHVTSQTQLSPFGGRGSSNSRGGSILKMLPLLPPAVHSITAEDTGRGVASLVALVECAQSSEAELPTYVLSLLGPNHTSVGDHRLPDGLLASSMTPGLPAGGCSAALPPDPNLAETPASTQDSEASGSAMYGLRGDVGKSAVLSYVGVVGGCRAEDGAGFLMPFLTNPFRFTSRDGSGSLTQSVHEEEAFYLSLPTPVNDVCTLAVDGRPAVAAATHTEIVLCYTDTLPSHFTIFSRLAVLSPCLSICCTANIIAAHSSGLITYYEFQAGALREKAAEITPFTVLTGMGGVDGFMVKTDARRNLTMTIVEDKPSKNGVVSDRYSLPAKMGTRLGSMGVRVVPVGQMCEASVAVPTTFSYFTHTSDPSLVSNFYNRPCRLFNHMLLTPTYSAVKQVFNYNEPFECYFSLQPLSQRFFVCGLDGSLRCLTRIPNEASRILQRLGTCIDNYNDNIRVELRETVSEDGTRPNHPGITTIPHYKARRVALDTRTVPESYTLHLRTLQEFLSLPADVREKVVTTFIQGENASPVTAGSLLELILSCRGLC